MTVISNNVETSAPDTSIDTTVQRRSQKNPRRKRSIQSTVRMVKRRIDKILQSRRMFPTVVVLLLVFGFIQVSRINNVLSPTHQTSYSSTAQGSSVGYDDLAELSDENIYLAPVKTDQFDERPEDDLQSNSQDSVSENKLANVWTTVDLRSLDLLPSLSVGSMGVRTSTENNEQLLNATLPDNLETTSEATYVVNEGGSLWRTGKRFIDDDALLNRLINNLANNGMDVRSVKPGVAFIVEDLGSEGMTVMVDSDGYQYKSFIVEGNVTTSVIGEETLGSDGLGT